MTKPACECEHELGVDRRVATAALLGAGLAGAALKPSGAFAEATTSPVQRQDDAFMRIALAEAAQGDFPFGAVIVRAGKELSRGRNLGRTTNDPTAHGEMVAIRRFVAERPAAELEGATLYTTGEPCPMCMSAILWCRIGRVVYGASIEELAMRLGQIMLTSRLVADAAPFAEISITGGVLSAQALELFPRP
ncbi:MAG: nucleoside deaminase [Bauldia sp.]|nr:MAG: nucleoside deaminase [Bauldia sp.]